MIPNTRRRTNDGQGIATFAISGADAADDPRAYDADWRPNIEEAIRSRERTFDGLRRANSFKEVALITELGPLWPMPCFALDLSEQDLRDQDIQALLTTGALALDPCGISDEDVIALSKSAAALEAIALAPQVERLDMLMASQQDISPEERVPWVRSWFGMDVRGVYHHDEAALREVADSAGSIWASTRRSSTTISGMVTRDSHGERLSLIHI